MEIRLQKALAAAGVAARRKCEELIAAGRVSVNGQIVTALGAKVLPQDRLAVDGKPVLPEPLVYYLLNKPKGYITTASDTHGRKTVVELVPDLPRVFPIGRLDMDTEGLLLLTNDGQLAHSLLHPSRRVPKTYRAVVAGCVTRAGADRLASGIRLEEGVTAPAKVELLRHDPGQTVVALTIHQGWKRQVKRMFQAIGFSVLALQRIGFAFLTLADVKAGEYRLLTAEEINKLKILSRKEGH